MPGSVGEKVASLTSSLIRGNVPLVCVSVCVCGFTLSPDESQKSWRLFFFNGLVFGGSGQSHKANTSSALTAISDCNLWTQASRRISCQLWPWLQWLCGEIIKSIYLQLKRFAELTPGKCSLTPLLIGGAAIIKPPFTVGSVFNSFLTSCSSTSDCCFIDNYWLLASIWCFSQLAAARYLRMAAHSAFLITPKLHIFIGKKTCFFVVVFFKTQTSHSQTFNLSSCFLTKTDENPNLNCPARWRFWV